LGEATQLERGSVQFTIETWCAQTGFLVRNGHQLGTVGFQCGRQIAQQLSTQDSVAGLPTFECCLSRMCGGVHGGRR
jgi:hypothetical protein